MLVTQGLTSFVCWLAYGAFMAKRLTLLRVAFRQRSRSGRALWAAALLVLSAAVLLLTFAATGERGFVGGRMSPTTWGVITAAGFAFVHLQSLAFAMVVSIVQDDVTAFKGSTSAHRSPGGIQEP